MHSLSSSSRGRLQFPLLAAAVGLVLSGCGPSSTASTASSSAGRASGSTPAASTAASASGPSTPSAQGSPSSLAAPTSAAGSAARTPPAGYSWHPGGGSTAVQVAGVDGGRTSLMWLDPSRLRFRYVPGYAVPEGSPATAADRTPSTWVPTMVAAFNSGFKLSDHVGGYYYLGRTVAPLRPGLASVVVHRDGSLALGVWGRDISMTADTVVVRQNLKPLVVGGVSQASTKDGTRTWGYANGNRPLANRSALGRLTDGSLVFVYSHDVTAAALASTLVRAGVTEAIMLDMNISWPTGFTYVHKGSTTIGARINAHTIRPPSTYLQRFKKDFFVVESA